MKVLVLPVRRNPNLNIKKLNNSLKQLVENYSNCTFIDVGFYDRKHFAYLKMICSNINSLIDSFANDTQLSAPNETRTPNIKPYSSPKCDTVQNVQTPDKPSYLINETQTQISVENSSVDQVEKFFRGE